MYQQLVQYLEAIKADYRSWTGKHARTDIDQQVRDEMAAEFCDSLTVEEGRKYFRVSTKSGAHSFIVIADDGKFKRGDILKAASFASPAKNYSRGNILQDGYSVRWTGTV